MTVTTQYLKDKIKIYKSNFYVIIFSFSDDGFLQGAFYVYAFSFFSVFFSLHCSKVSPPFLD